MNIASIDIGTNTVILLIAEINGNKFNSLKNEFRIPRIGKGLKLGGKITDDKIIELLIIMSDYKKIIDRYNCNQVMAIATNAFRLSSNSKDIIDLIYQKTGIKVEIISGEEEAVFCFLGALSGYTNKTEDTLVIDIGGGSTELIFGQPGEIKYKKSFITGVVSGTEKYFLHNPPLPKEIDKFVNYLHRTFIEIKISNPVKTIAIAGTPTTLACIQKKLTKYNEDEVEGFILKSEDVKNLIKELSSLSPLEIGMKYQSIVDGREDVLLAGTIILFELMNILKVQEVVVSTKGIRYGVIYKNIINKYI